MRRRTEKKLLNVVRFHRLGNLAFYPGSPDVADPSRHFFYFKTLLTDYSRGGFEIYRIKANRIGNAAKKALTNSPFGNTDTEKEISAIARLKQSLDIIDEGIRYEQSNELKYIEQRLNKLDQITKDSGSKTKDINLIDKNLKQLKVQIEKNLENKELSPNDGVDYRLLIDTINIALQGGENSKAIYNYEYERLNEDVTKRFLAARDEFATQVDNYTRSHGLKEKGEDIEYINKAMQKFDRMSTQVYLQSHTFDITKPKGSIQQILKKTMKGTKTIDVVMGEKITQYLNEIFSNEEQQQKIINIIKKNNLDVNGYAKAAKEIKPVIIGLITKFANENLSDIIKNNLNIESIVDDFQKEIDRTSTQEYQIQINGLYQNFAQYGNQLDFFKNEITDILENTQSAAGLYDALVKFNREVNKEIKKKKVSGLDADTRQVREMLGLNSKKSKHSELITFIENLRSFQKKIKKSKDPRKIQDLILPSNEEGKTITLSVIKNAKGEIEVQGLDKLGQTNVAATLNIKQTYSPKKLEDAISYFKRRASEELRDSLTEIIRKAADDNMRAQIYNQLGKKLQNIRISVGGPTRNEITGAIQQGLTDNTIWTGKLNVKNDVVSISIDVPTLFSFKLENSINGLTTDINNRTTELMERSTKEYGDAYVTFIHNNLKDINKNHEYTNYERLTKDFLKANQALEEKYANITAEFTKAEKQLNELIEQEKISKDDAEKIIEQQKAFLEELQNTIYVSSTMKTFNHYQNNIGFVGGSIGAGAAAQISNLNTLFKAAGAGLTNEQIDWLTFAVINNSPESVIELKNETLIETMLGSLAIFAMFDEGGAELIQLKERLQGSIQTMKIDPKIMHLYLLNGIYYPGSYVLATIRQTLLEMLDAINDVTENKNAIHNSIRISNSVNMGDLPNKRGKVIESESTLDTGAWGTMAETADKKASVHVVFLAGLLDVIKELRDAEKGIYLP